MKPPEVLLLGTEHLSDWSGPDPSNDILSERRQRELDELIEHLAKFDPTKVAVEVLASRQEELDAWYQRSLKGEAEPDRNEIFQTGFRLAARLELSRVYAIDADWSLDWDGVEERLERHPEEDPGEGLSPEAADLVAHARGQIESSSISELLALANASDLAVLNDREYLNRFLMIGAGDNWGGVDLVASWYKRNLRILANLLSIAEDADRILVVFGLGHVHSLKHFISTTSRLRLVPASEYLSG